MTPFGSRVRDALDRFGPLCVGIDPHDALLDSWGLGRSAAGARELGLRTVAAAAQQVGFVKPQVAFFERWGGSGFVALEEVIAAARAAGLIVISDAKRGDIGSTMAGYAQAWLAPGAPLESDAVTVSPYLGVESLSETFALAQEHGKGVFVLAATSNPEGAVLQRAVTAAGSDSAGASPGTVASQVVDDVSRWNRARTSPGKLADIGFVIGATVDTTSYHLPRTLTPPAPILAPGFGSQGAEPGELSALFGPTAPDVIANESRSVLSAGPDGIASRIRARAGLYPRIRHV